MFKSPFLMTLLFLFSLKVFGQTTCPTYTANDLPTNCAINMALTGRFTDITILNKANNNSPIYYKQGYYIPDVRYDEENGEHIDETVNRCVLTDDCSNVSNPNPGDSILYYEVYYPTCYPYLTASQLPPAIFMEHPGAISDCSSLENTKEITRMCENFAHRGFVVFNIEYRRGRVITQRYGQLWNSPFDNLKPSETYNVGYTSAQFSLAHFRYFQDIRGAIRTILYRNTFTTEYKFDSTKIFLGGASAGSYAMLNAAYYTDNMVDTVAAGANNPNVLDSIRKSWYIGPKTINYQSKILGVLNMWGNVFIPPNMDYATFFANAPPIPLISFQGYQDHVAAPYYEPIYYTPVSPDIYSEFDLNTPKTEKLHSEPDCLLSATTYSSPASTAASIDGLKVGGNKIWCYMMNELPPAERVYSELYVDTSMGHGIKDDNDDFGTGLTGSAVFDYIMVRAATFFQACLQGPTFISQLMLNNRLQVFVNCVNNRVKACYTTNPPIDNSTNNHTCTACSTQVSESEICDGIYIGTPCNN